ncbi:hypothetical protein KKF84_19080 [Myxococcota bacterium]|nr:hypothetical protein [Myxococcota bacterium]
MASKLSSYLVKQDLIPVKKLDRAFKRQVIHGGTLDTTLIEMGLFSELSIIRSIVEVSGIPTIQLKDIEVGEVKDLVKAFPPKLAKRYSVIPVTKNGDFLGVLVNPEIEKIKLEEMGFMLGITLIPRVVPEIRLWEIARLIYGFEIDERVQKILEKVGPAAPYPGELVQPFGLEKFIEEKAEPAPRPTEEEPDEFDDDALRSSGSGESEAVDKEPDPAPGHDPEEMTPPPRVIEIPHYQEDPRATLVMTTGIIGQAPLSQDSQKKTEAFNIEDDDSDDDSTPIPSFEYVERDISSDILVPTLANGGAHIATPEEIRRSEELSDFDEEVTKPGFQFKTRREDVKKIKDLVLASDRDDAPVPDDDSPDDDFSDDGGMESPQTEDSTSPELAAGETGSSSDSPAPADESAPVGAPAPVSSGIDAFMPGLPDLTEPMVIPKAMPTGQEGALFSFDGSSISLVELVSLLIDMQDRDEMLIHFLRYGSQFVDFSYLFTVSGDAAQGKFAIFNGQVDQHNVRNYLIALDFPSLLQQANKSKGYVGEAPDDSGNGFVFDYLSLGRPKNVFVFPVAIGKRVVAILFGATNRDFAPSLFADMTTAAVAVSKGLLRLIKEQKIAKSIDSMKDIGSSKKLKVVKRFKSGVERAAISAGTVIPEKPDINNAVTAPMPTSRDADSKLEKIIALFDRLEHISHQQDRLDMEAAEQLKMHKDQTLEVLAFYFPGMITFKLPPEIEAIPPPSEHGPLLSFIVHWGLPCVPVVMDLLDSENPMVRFYAVYLFIEIRLPEVLYRIGERLFDADEKVRKVAGKVLLSYEGHKELAEITANIRNFLLSEEPFLQKCSIEAIGRLRDKASIDTLVSLFDRQNQELSQLAADALRHITLRDFQDKRERWNSWLALNKRRHRILWLIEALRASDKALRLEAHNELLRIVGTDNGYSPEFEGEQMELAIRNWISWWENKGRHIFHE